MRDNKGHVEFKCMINGEILKILVFSLAIIMAEEMNFAQMFWFSTSEEDWQQEGLHWERNMEHTHIEKIEENEKLRSILMVLMKSCIL